MDSGSILEGTEILYHLRLHGIPVHWSTEISATGTLLIASSTCRDRDHTDFGTTRTALKAHEGRTRMIDVLRYTLPFGVLGRLVHALKVRGDVRRISDYRRQRIENSHD